MKTPVGIAEGVPTRPALRYHGGKFRLREWVVSHFPSHELYCETHGGAASVLLAKERSYGEIYNDLDGSIVNFFRVLRDPVLAAELERQLRLTPFARAEFAEAWEPTDDPIEAARRVAILAFMGKSSAAATTYNRNGTRNRDGFRKYVQPGSHGPHPAREWGNYPDQIPLLTERLRGVVIESMDACALFRQHDAPRTLFYVDPPYPLNARGVDKRPRYAHEMTDDDHRKLAGVLHAAQGMIVLSGYPCPLYDKELYPDWQRVTCKAFADAARPRTEGLWLNAAAWEGMQRGQLCLYSEDDE